MTQVAALYDADVPAGTSITVEVSLDNGTSWVDITANGVDSIVGNGEITATEGDIALFRVGAVE
jgi:hypothetical protein